MFNFFMGHQAYSSKNIKHKFNFKKDIFWQLTKEEIEIAGAWINAQGKPIKEIDFKSGRSDLFKIIFNLPLNQKESGEMIRNMLPNDFWEYIKKDYQKMTAADDMDTFGIVGAGNTQLASKFRKTILEIDALSKDISVILTDYLHKIFIKLNSLARSVYVKTAESRTMNYVCFASPNLKYLLDEDNDAKAEVSFRNKTGQLTNLLMLGDARLARHSLLDVTENSFERTAMLIFDMYRIEMNLDLFVSSRSLFKRDRISEDFMLEKWVHDHLTLAHLAMAVHFKDRSNLLMLADNRGYTSIEFLDFLLNKVFLNNFSVHEKDKYIFKRDKVKDDFYQDKYNGTVKHVMRTKYIEFKLFDWKYYKGTVGRHREVVKNILPFLTFLYLDEKQFMSPILTSVKYKSHFKIKSKIKNYEAHKANLARKKFIEEVEKNDEEKKILRAEVDVKKVFEQALDIDVLEASTLNELEDVQRELKDNEDLTQ